MHKLTAMTMAALGLMVAAPAATRAADEVMVVCANTPSHPDCGKTEHFKVSAEAEIEGKAAFKKMREQLFKPDDPVAQALAYAKWGKPDGFEDLITEAFFYPVDKAKCVYAEAERVFYNEESGPIEDGTNENTARATLIYLNNIAPKNLVFKEQGVYLGTERLFLAKTATDAERVKKEWGQIFAQHCKGK